MTCFRSGSLVAATVAATLAAAAPPVHAEDGYDRARFQRDVNAVGASGAVGVLGEVTTPSGRMRARSGVADLRTRRPMPLDGHFRLGSTTKTFVATAMLRLVGEGRVALDDTVEKWLPGVVAGNGNDGTAITIRHLLQHTSGLADYTRDLIARLGSAEAWRRERLRTWHPAQLVALAMGHRPGFAPGTRWSYSSTGYLLAGMIIEKVTGRTWQQEVRRTILVPLGLRHTITPGAWPLLPHPHARAYQRFQPDGPLTDVTVQNPSAGDAAGSMISTTGDLTRFFRALVGGRLLAPAQLAEMRRTVPAKELEMIGVPGARFGLGLLYRPLSCGGGYWSHGGDDNGYRTREGVTPDGRRSAVASTTSRSPADLTSEQGANRALSALVDNALCG